MYLTGSENLFEGAAKELMRLRTQESEKDQGDDRVMTLPAARSGMERAVGD
jgi:hypothetical protein